MSIEKARAARSHNAAMTVMLRGGKISITEALYSSDPRITRRSLWNLLTTAHAMGPAGARKVCEQSRVPSHLTVGELTNTQKSAVEAALPRRAQ